MPICPAGPLNHQALPKPAGPVPRKLARGVATWFCSVALMSMVHAQESNSLEGMQPCLDAMQARDAVVLLNQLRAEGAAPCAATAGDASPSAKPLVWQPSLAATAQDHAQDLARQGSLSHVDTRQRSFAMRLQLSGYPVQLAGENLAAGQNDAAEVMKAWLQSPSHCQTLMGATFSEVGLACVHNPGSRFERFWVAHFAAPLHSRRAVAAR